jgi:hypothetical protein
MTMIPVPNTDDILARIILDFLQSKQSICVFEESMARPSDPCMKTAKQTQWRTFENEIYYLLTWENAEISQISRALKDAASVYPGFIGVIAEVSEIEQAALKQRKITADSLARLAGATDRIIVGAYDGEGYLVWAKRDSAGNK